MKSFWDGFEKKALQDTQLKEDLATGATSILPLGTTLHTALKSDKGGDRALEWGARQGLGLLGALPGAALVNGGYVAPGVLLALAGRAGGEILANRLVHKDKYDPKGNLKSKYK